MRIANRIEGIVIIERNQGVGGLSRVIRMKGEMCKYERSSMKYCSKERDYGKTEECEEA